MSSTGDSGSSSNEGTEDGWESPTEERGASPGRRRGDVVYEEFGLRGDRGVTAESRVRLQDGTRVLTRFVVCGKNGRNVVRAATRVDDGSPTVRRTRRSSRTTSRKELADTGTRLPEDRVRRGEVGTSSSVPVPAITSEKYRLMLARADAIRETWAKHTKPIVVPRVCGTFTPMQVYTPHKYSARVHVLSQSSGLDLPNAYSHGKGIFTIGFD
ncbi:hypothetical protein AAG570_005763 [Ranatra chinensis]|uniref:Uncharacterized protein n=1 Tax=Ranatra chinensis TaxID=642074 RepID=A0ABD0YB61_9HEMI